MHDAYVVLVTLHVISAVVGFAAIALSGIYGGTAGHLDKAGAIAESRRFFATPNRLALATLAVPFFAVAALAAGGHRSEFGDAWVSAALAVWLVVAGVFTSVVRPAERDLAQLLQAEPPDPAAVAPVARRLSRAAAGCDVAFVIALGLMIWQP
jgi:hypothetical protein